MWLERYTIYESFVIDDSSNYDNSNKKKKIFMNKWKKRIYDNSLKYKT